MASQIEASRPSEDRGQGSLIVLGLLIVTAVVALAIIEFSQNTLSLTVSAILVGLVVSTVGLAFAGYNARWILSQNDGDDKMRRIAAAIQEGARAFLQREYRAVAVLGIGVVVVLLILSAIPNSGMSPWTALAFVAGAVASSAAGYFGMYIAVRANIRTTAAAAKGLNQGLRVAFASGTVMGTTVVGLALLGISALFLFFTQVIYPDNPSQAVGALTGFGFGATSIAIFARVGGGIFTKAADVGADLVGKTEAGIPEDDPRNPAVIADNVGDNVGDVAGMGSDLFESYASSIIAAIAIATVGGIATEQSAALQAFPLLVAAAGLLIGMACTYLVRTKEHATQEELLGSLRRGVWSASALVALAVIILGSLLNLEGGIVIATISGLVAGVLIGFTTEYFTSDTYKPTQHIAESASGGPALVIIRGLAVGMESTVAPVIIVIFATLIAMGSAELYGVAMAAVGMLATLGITLATDAYGPVADNAGGLAEMAGLEGVVRERTDALDSLGNTTAATGKGFAIGSAVMTALALISAFVAATGMDPNINILDPRLPTGLMLGAVLPFLFSAMTMLAVGKAAGEIVDEVRRQFREIPGLMEGTADPDYARCVAISTDSAIRQMILPGVIAVGVPAFVALLSVLFDGTPLEQYVNVDTLVGVLLGSLISAFTLGLMMSNAGGAWDNAKKYIERGHMGGKKSDAHKATVVGDTVGDPFKDTSGPSLNILLKLLAIVSLVIAPLLTSTIG
jgi:K(+)-stimulated pyrophosphate-energized sodium pump